MDSGKQIQVQTAQRLIHCCKQDLVPQDKDLRTHIIFEHHAPKHAGHKGKRKTLAAIERTFWWPKLHLDVSHFVGTCDACQRNKHTNMKPAGLLQPLQLPARRWEHVSMDLITQLNLCALLPPLQTLLLGKLLIFLQTK